MSENGKTPPKQNTRPQVLPMGIGGGRGSAEKAQDFRGTLKRLIAYLAPQKYRFLAVFVLAIGSTIFSIVGPKIMGQATTKIADGLIAKMVHFVKLQYAIVNKLPPSALKAIQDEPVALFDMRGIANILLMLVGLYLLSSILSFAMNYIMSGVAQRSVFDMRSDVKSKLDRLPLRYYDSRTHGEILSRVTNDMDTVANTLQQSLTQLITSITTILGILVMMLSISPLMTLIALVTLPVSFAFTMVVAKNSQRYFVNQQQEIGALNGHIEEMYTGHKVVKVFGHEPEAIAKFDEINNRYYEVGWKAQFISGLIQPALNFVSNVGYVLVCIVGGLLVNTGGVKVGDVQAFIQYMRNFTMPIVQTANIANVMQSTIAAAERVFEVLDEQEEIADIEQSVPFFKAQGHVHFDHVKFSYNPETPLMRDINIDVQPGATIAIVGPTGAGKTTLINLLMRFYEIDDGTIRVDGVDIREMKRADLRRNFGMVLQDTWLFNGTIYDNIKYGNEQASEEEVFQAARSAYADHFIRALPEGYQTVLNEEASNISQGQKQLLTIARALLSDPAILILDEATSNVDTRTELLIQSAMDTLMQGRTSFVIAHRLSTIKNADLILVMNKGTIVEQGTQAQLLAAKGFYADLYYSQFADTE